MFGWSRPISMVTFKDVYYQPQKRIRYVFIFRFSAFQPRKKFGLQILFTKEHFFCQVSNSGVSPSSSSLVFPCPFQTFSVLSRYILSPRVSSFLHPHLFSPTFSPLLYQLSNSLVSSSPSAWTLNWLKTRPVSSVWHTLRSLPFTFLAYRNHVQEIFRFLAISRPSASRKKRSSLLANWLASANDSINNVSAHQGPGLSWRPRSRLPFRRRNGAKSQRDGFDETRAPKWHLRNGLGTAEGAVSIFLGEDAA